MSRQMRMSMDGLPYHGQQIIQKLQEKNEPQRWLATQCGVTKGAISNIITGITLPSLPVAAKICKALDCSLDDIFKGIE